MVQSPSQDLALNDSHSLLSSGLATHRTHFLSEEFAKKEDVS